jgi:tetratricopeptide (TPR) repeat protein
VPADPIPAPAPVVPSPGPQGAASDGSAGSRARPAHSESQQAQAQRASRKRHKRWRGSRINLRGILDPWVERILVVVVVGSVLALGTSHVPTLMVVGALAVAAAGLASRLHYQDHGRWPVSWPALAFVGLTAWTALQALPLPARALALLAPRNADVWARALAPLGEPGPAWAPITLDPGATWVEVFKGVTYLCVVLASTVVAARRGAVFGVSLVFVSALLVGAVTVAHGFGEMDKVFGLYEPENTYSPWHIGPLLNANHLAGYLNLGALCGVGLLLMRRPAAPSWLVTLGVATAVGLSVMTASRAGVVLLPVGFALVALVLRGRQARDANAVPGRALRHLAAAALGGGLLLAALGLTTHQWKELLDKDLSKLLMISWAKQLVLDHKWFGIGRGAFETVYPGYRPTTGNWVYTHAENLPIQWLSEWGAVASLAATAFLVAVMLPRRIGATRSSVVAGAWAGIVVLALHNWADFSLEIPAVAIAVASLLGAAWGDTARRGAAPVPRAPLPEAHTFSPRANWLPAVLGVAGALALLAAWKKGIPGPTQDREAFHALARRAPIATDAYRGLLRAAMLRHPAEPYLPLVGAERAWRARDDNPIPYLERALERAPIYGRAHLLLAEILAARGATGQAMLELRLCVEQDRGLVTPAVAAAIRTSRKREDLDKMVPVGRPGAEVLDTLAAWLTSSSPQLAAQLDEEALRRDPSLPNPHERLGMGLVADLERGEQGLRCSGDAARRDCVARVESHARGLCGIASESSRGERLRARLLLALARPADAAALLEQACERASDRVPCLMLRTEALARLKDQARVERELKRIVTVGCSDTHECIQTWTWHGDFSRAHGNLGAAVSAYEHAVELDPANEYVWAKLADAASQIGQHAQAAHALERVLQSRPGDVQLEEKLRSERAKALGSFNAP